MYAEILTTSGTQELEIRRREDGAIELEHVGDDPGGAAVGRSARLAGGPGECSDPAYTDLLYRVDASLHYRISLRSTPPEISRRSARSAIRRAASNVFDTENACRLGDRVPEALRYDGNTRAHALGRRRPLWDRRRQERRLLREPQGGRSRRDMHPLQR